MKSLGIEHVCRRSDEKSSIWLVSSWKTTLL